MREYRCKGDRTRAQLINPIQLYSNHVRFSETIKAGSLHQSGLYSYSLMGNVTETFEPVNGCCEHHKCLECQNEVMLTALEAASRCFFAFDSRFLWDNPQISSNFFRHKIQKWKYYLRLCKSVLLCHPHASRRFPSSCNHLLDAVFLLTLDLVLLEYDGEYEGRN